MFLHGYDSSRLILLLMHEPGASTETDFDANVAQMEQFGRDCARSPRQTASLIILANSDNVPSPRHRQRLGEVEAAIPQLNLAFVSTSKAALAIMTVMSWLAPSRPGLLRTTHRSYELARDWHASLRLHPAAAFDSLHAAMARPSSAAQVRRW
jgi:hypothetical protein